MTSLPPSLAMALITISSMMGQDPTVINVFTELQLYLENNKDQLDVANTKNVQLEAELNQVTSKLNVVSQSLAMALARPASSNLLGGAQQAPKLSKIFADPRTYCMMVLGVRNLKSGGHTFMCGKMRILLLLQG